MTTEGWISTALLAAHPIRAGAFIVTLYGDAITPRGGEVWVGNIIEACAGVGISETLVRTAVSRLVGAGILVGTREGRRSFYRLDARLRDEFETVGGLLFDPPSPPKDWMVLAAEDGNGPPLPGFARLGGGLWIGPRPEGGLPPGAVLQARGLAGPEMQALAARLWSLGDLGRDWQGFLDRHAGLDPRTPPKGPEALVARLCLTHAFRRLVLATPQLPAEAFPPDWPGHRGRTLFARLYLALSPEAESHLAAQFANSSGGLPRETGQSRSRLEALERRLDRG